jgi:hypothetical protein
MEVADNELMHMKRHVVYPNRRVRVLGIVDNLPRISQGTCNVGKR